MKVQVGKEVDVPDEAVEHVARELGRSFRSVMYDSRSRDQREHTNHSRAIAAKAIAEYLEWTQSHRHDGRGPG